uniref:Uncharacterized protein n=1 Tax=Ditylenchus dipsaci TaxID=166011 RepID=A0A915DXK7_9BILA
MRQNKNQSELVKDFNKPSSTIQGILKDKKQLSEPRIKSKKTNRFFPVCDSKRRIERNHSREYFKKCGCRFSESNGIAQCATILDVQLKTVQKEDGKAENLAKIKQMTDEIEDLEIKIVLINNFLRISIFKHLFWIKLYLI